MGLAVVKVASGGLPVTIATTGGLPCTEATNGYGIAVTEAPAGVGGLAVTGFVFGPTVALSASSVLETAAVNTTVGTLSVTGSYTGTPVFTLADSAGGKFNISGTTLRTNAALDYETATSHSITVAVSGTTPAVPNKSFTIIVLNVVAAAAPVLALTSGATDTTPDFTLSGDLALNDVVRFQYSTASDFTGASELTNAIDAGEDAANSINFSTGALALGTWYFRARIERPDADASAWSNTVTVTLIAGAYDASTTAWINAVVTAGGTVSDTQKTRVDALIVALKSHSLFALMDRLWVHGGESVSQQATIDIVNLQTCTPVNPSLVAAGYQGNGSTRYIDTNYTPPTHGVNFSSKDYGSIFVYNTNSSTAGNNSVIMGAGDGVNCYTEIIPRDGSGNLFCRVQNIPSPITTATANRQGMLIATAAAEFDERTYKNGAPMGTSTAGTYGIVALVNFYLLARNGAGSPQEFSSDTVFVSGVCAGLTPTQAANLSADINAYATAWGVNVYV